MGIAGTVYGLHKYAEEVERSRLILAISKEEVERSRLILEISRNAQQQAVRTRLIDAFRRDEVLNLSAIEQLPRVSGGSMTDSSPTHR